MNIKEAKQCVKQWLKEHPSERMLFCPFSYKNYCREGHICIICLSGENKWCRFIFPEIPCTFTYNTFSHRHCPCHILPIEDVVVRAKLFVKGELDDG